MSKIIVTTQVSEFTPAEKRLMRASKCLYCRKPLPQKTTKPFKFCKDKDGKSRCKFNYYYEQRIPYFQEYYRNKIVPMRRGR